MARLAIDAREAVEVLVERQLEDGGATIAGDDGRRGEEVGPDAEPLGAVLGDDLVFVGDPVMVPSVEGRGVVDTAGMGDECQRRPLGPSHATQHANSQNVTLLDLEANLLELTDDPVEGDRGVGSREDVPKGGKEERDGGKGAEVQGDVSRQTLLLNKPSTAYLFMKRPQIRSSNCHEGRIPATWKTKIPSSSRRL